MTPIAKRLREFIAYKGMNVMELSTALQYSSPQKLYRLFNTHNAWPSCRIITDVSNKFEELNLNWLFTGTGQMLVEKRKPRPAKGHRGTEGKNGTGLLP